MHQGKIHKHHLLFHHGGKRLHEGEPQLIQISWVGSERSADGHQHCHDLRMLVTTQACKYGSQCTGS